MVLSPQAQRRHINEQKVLGVLTSRSGRVEDARLDGRTVGHGLVRVHLVGQLLELEELLDQVLHFRDASGPADHHHFIDLILLHPGIIQDLLHGGQCPLEEVRAELFEFSPGQGHREVLPVHKCLHLNRDLELGG
mmetsp:Transcript_30415/g.66755  ORF Transcript_30415/g.66755 Transcript_30415/m.66755 type:complete len:135 (-) Transcript_30415:77-481(-)